MEDLNTIIEDAITDVELPADPITDSTDLSPTPDTSVVPEATETPSEPVLETPVEPTKSAPVDDFDKRFGLTPTASSGRENRIPYTRVRKITDNAVKEARTSWEKEITTSHVPVTKYQEVEKENTTYKSQLAQVAEFEKVMVNDHARFIGMLSEIPGYAQILAPLFNPQAQTPEAPAQAVGDDMPQPDQKLSDGSSVYSMDGLKSLLAWQAKQVESRVTKQVEERYKPIESDFQRYQAVQAVIPKVQQQIAEARTWPLFNESEDEIVQILQKNPTMNLDAAYRTIVWPKLQASRDQMRQEILKEVKTAPRSTSVPAGSVRTAPSTQSGPRSLEQVIADSIKGLK
jgi:hypothetical protein